jgi:hypothetical protein
MLVYTLFFAGTIFSGLVIRTRLATAFFLIAVFVFVGLRLDTGFDWPVYKQMYNQFLTGFSLNKVFEISLFYWQEPGFVLLLGLTTALTGSYVVLQAIVTLLFLWSTVRLSRELGIRKVALVIGVAMAFLMWSVGFSTLRQSIAISLFNFGLVYCLRGRHGLGWSLFASSLLFQLSAVMYIAAYFIARAMYRISLRPSFLRYPLIAVITMLTFSTVAGIASIISPFAAAKLEVYLETGSIFRLGQIELMFLIFTTLTAALASSAMTIHSRMTYQTRQIQYFIIVLAGIGAGVSFVAVMRDRISYELFLVASIYLISGVTQFRHQFLAALTVFALLNTSLFVFRYPTRLAFIPYQNVVTHTVFGWENTGPTRSDMFLGTVQ